MGILNLRYGYFARLGAGTVIEDPTSGWNAGRTEDLQDFHKVFVDNYFRLKKFMPANAVDRPGTFEINSENCQKGNNFLQTIAKRSQHRYSLVVHTLEDDLLNKYAKNLPGNRNLFNSLCRLTHSYERQIFDINDEKYPLTPAILREKGSDLPFYLMDNAYQAKQRIDARYKRWDRDAAVESRPQGV